MIQALFNWCLCPVSQLVLGSSRSAGSSLRVDFSSLQFYRFPGHTPHRFSFFLPTGFQSRLLQGLISPVQDLGAGFLARSSDILSSGESPQLCDLSHLYTAVAGVWFFSSRGRLYLCLSYLWGFPCGSAGKESTCNGGDLGLIPGLGRSPGEGKGYPLQYSGPENSMES